MLKKPFPPLPRGLIGGLAVLVVLLLVLFFYRPISVMEEGLTIAQFRPAVPLWTVGQALYQANVPLDPADQVTPAIDQPIPWNGTIQIQRTAQITLWENGQVTNLRGPVRTPQGLLSQAGIKLNPGDRLLRNGLPIDPAAALPAGENVLQLVRARPVRVVVDGAESMVAASGPTNAHALWQAGVRIGPGDLVSAPLHTAPLADDVLAHQAARPLSIQLEGQTLQSRSAATTVGQALAEAGVSLQKMDFSRPAEDQPLPGDGQIQVVRVREEIALTQELIPFSNNTQPDPELALDEQRVLNAGQYGVKVVRERVRYEDEMEVSRAFDSDWVASEPQDQTIGYGSMIVPKTLDTPSGPIEYYRVVHVYATSYSPCRLGTSDGRCGYTTANGMRLTKGIIGTSKAWFQLFRGHPVYVEGYGPGVIADYGAVGSHRIDLGFDDENFEEGAFVGWVNLYFLTPAPANVPLVLP